MKDEWSGIWTANSSVNGQPPLPPEQQSPTCLLLDWGRSQNLGERIEPATFLLWGNIVLTPLSSPVQVKKKYINICIFFQFRLASLHLQCVCRQAGGMIRLKSLFFSKTCWEEFHEPPLCNSIWSDSRKMILKQCQKRRKMFQWGWVQFPFKDK